MNQHRRIGLTDAASFLLAIYYLWYQLPFMRATFQAERYKYLFLPALRQVSCCCAPPGWRIAGCVCG